MADDREYRKHYEFLKGEVEKRLAQVVAERKPHTVYDPIRYILKSGGKRVRPVLLLLSCEVVGANIREALDAAAAIEVLHTFTLVHDDIMDEAETRRGRPTIHTTWDSNVAILSGDQMVALAFRSLLRTKSVPVKHIAQELTRAFIEVCEGQGYDKEFEERTDVSVEEYLRMVEKKTAVMISTATAIGAMVGRGARREVIALRRFGRFLGIAFQIQDDMLDIVGDESEFGKKIGGDLKQGKKTYPILRALESVRGRDRELIRRVMQRKVRTKRQIRDVRRMMESHGAIDDTRELVRLNTRRAQAALGPLRACRAKEMLHWLADELLVRSH
jgi:geranylgeranyl diphosphate synthase type II